MPRMTLAKCIASALLAGLFLAVLGSGEIGQPSLAGEAAAAKRADPGEPIKLEKVYYGVSACAKCHDQKEEAAGYESLLYRGTEMHTWKSADKHKDATKNLLEKGSRGEAMAKILGIKVTDRQCINCHGVYTDEPMDEDRLVSGVSCVVCHGPYKNWVIQHMEGVSFPDSKWKWYTPKEKTDLGLNILWDPERRATLCSSCHVGNVGEGKVVTHEMYAAGHPPLPGFEIATFSQFMPAHWESLTTKINKVKENVENGVYKKSKKYKHLEKFKDYYKEIGYYNPAQGDEEQTRMLVFSAVVTFRESVRLLHDTAEKAIAEAKRSEKPDNPAWPELAVYDCYACHHDLQADSWRQKRGYSGPPGRPQMRPWSQTLVPLAIAETGKTDMSADFHKEIKSLEGAFNKTPFGRPEDVLETTSAVIKWSDGLVADMRKAKFDSASAHKLLAKLVDRKPKEYLDFDSARQVGWGVRTILGEIDPPALKRKEVAELTDKLMLDLLRGRKEIVGDYLNATLIKLNAYSPDDFRKTIDALRKLPGKVDAKQP